MLRAVEPAVYGPYLLLERLGSGGAGEAFLARPLDRARNVPSPIVLKRLHRQLVHTENFVSRFLHEAEMAINTDSPHVARVYDVGAAEGTFFIAIEHVPGWTMTTLLTTLVEEVLFPPIEVATRIISQALIGLTALHSATDDAGRPLGFVHRDIAPKNLMAGDDGVVRIIDLGLGKSNIQDWQTATGAMLGSVGYMAPEQVAGTEVDARADLYAIGVVLYELLTVRRWIPFGPVLDMVQRSLVKDWEPPSRFRPDVSPALDEVLRRAMAGPPHERFASAEHFLEALHRASPPRARIEDVRRFLHRVFGEKVMAERAKIARLLQIPLPDSPSSADTVILKARRGVSKTLEEEPTTAPSREGLLTEPEDPSEVPTFGLDEDDSEVPTYDSEFADDTAGLEAIPPGDTEPAGLVTVRDERSPLATPSPEELRERALALRARLHPADSRHGPLDEVLAYLALAGPEPNAADLDRLASLSRRLTALEE